MTLTVFFFHVLNIYFWENTQYIASLLQVNSLSAGDIFGRLLIASENSLDPDQAQQNVGPDLDPKLFDALMALLK